MTDFPNYPYTEPLIFDSHAHYDDAKFDEIRAELLAELPAHGVCGVVNCGCDTASSKAALALAEKYPYFYAAVGIHPDNIGGGEVTEIEDLARRKKCVAIGEIGLDYYWVDDNKEQQRALFEEQLVLANRLNLPVIVHDREAHAEMYELLRQYRPRGVLHCYSGSAEDAAWLTAQGMALGFGGAVTYKGAKRAAKVLAMVPHELAVLETDCPYMSPEPVRGTRNDSRNIAHVAAKIGEIWQMDAQSVLDLTAENAKRIFNQ